MRGRKNLLLAAGFLAASFVFALFAAQANNRANAVWQKVTLHLEEPLSAEDARTLLGQEHEMAFTLWGERKGETVTDPDLARRTQTDVFTVCGNPCLVFPMSGGLSGEDAAGCLIGEQTAWELFGSTNVTGSRIRIKDETYTIRGVLKQPGIGVAINGLREETPSYNRITLDSKKAAEGESFLMRNGLNGETLRLDYFGSPHWLAELVPGKWSDFSGWKENFKRKKEDFALLSQIEKTSIELCYENQCRQYLGYTGMEVFCIVLAVVLALKGGNQKDRKLLPFPHIKHCRRGRSSSI